MSIESISNPSSDDFFRDFSDTQIDPLLGQVFAKMKLYNQLLEHEYVTSNQINEIMKELDDEWRDLLHKTAIVTGIISLKPPKINDSESDEIVDFYDDIKMEFGGVLPIQTDARTLYAVNDDGSDETTHRYMLGLRFIRIGLSKDGTVSKIEGAASLDDIASLEFSEMMSPDGARVWLEYYHGEAIEDIEIDLFKDSKEECASLLRLQDHEVAASEPHKGDKTLTARSLRALDTYTNSLFTFDRTSPYLLKADGPAWDVISNGTKEVAYAFGETMVSLEKIVWLEKAGGHNKKVVPHVAAGLLNEHKDEPDKLMLIPVSSIISLKSFRHDYFVGYDDTSSK